MAGEAALGDPSRLFARLRAERESQELTVEWVADRLGITKQTISEYELGKSKPSLGLLRRWLQALKLPATWADAWRRWGIQQEVDKLIARGGMSERDREMIVRMIERSWPE